MRDIRTVPVGGRTYRIIWDGDLCDELCGRTKQVDGEFRANHGVIDYSSERIVLHPDWNKSAVTTLETLFHETGHGCEPFLGRTFNHEILNAYSNLQVGWMLRSGLIVPRELSIAGVPLTKRRQPRGSADKA